MIGIEIVKDQIPRGRRALRDRIVELAFERGLLLLGCERLQFGWLLR